MSNFIQNRTPFIVLHGDVLIKKTPDERTCLEWVMDLGYSKEQWERAVRGYVSEDRVQFFTGKDYTCVHVVNDSIIRTLSTYHASVYGYMPKNFFNGVNRGADGEFWQPISEIRRQS